MPVSMVCCKSWYENRTALISGARMSRENPFSHPDEQNSLSHPADGNPFPHQKHRVAKQMRPAALVNRLS